MYIEKTPLCLLAEKFGTDKCPTQHNYTPTYYGIMRKNKQDKLNILEIGVSTGASIKMWLTFFENANIFGLDKNLSDPVKNDLESFGGKRVHLFRGSQNDKKMLISIARIAGTFDFIIDDGSHRPEDMQITLATLLKYVRLGGYYFIEDLGCKRTTNTNITMVQTLNSLSLYRRANFEALTESENKYIAEFVTASFVTCKNRLAVLKRG
jgi:hypothetical protein